MTPLFCRDLYPIRRTRRADAADGSPRQLFDRFFSETPVWGDQNRIRGFGSGKVETIVDRVVHFPWDSNGPLDEVRILVRGAGSPRSREVVIPFSFRAVC
jgi:hypothetical protein